MSALPRRFGPVGTSFFFGHHFFRLDDRVYLLYFSQAWRCVITRYAIVYASIIRKSPPPRNHQLNVVTSDSKQQVDHFVGELTFEN